MSIFETVLEQSSRKSSGPLHFIDHAKNTGSTNRKLSLAGLSSATWEVELHAVEDLPDLREEIAGLATRSLDRNLFFEPDILEAFLPRMRGHLPAHDISLLCLREQVGMETHLRLFMPLGVAKTGFPKRKTIQVLATEYLPDGTPLIDETASGEACDILLRALANPVLALPPLLTFRLLRTESKAAKTLQSAAERNSLAARASGIHRRACLTTTPAIIAEKRQRECDRKKEQLGEKGTVSITSASTMPAIMDAFENHLVLELNGREGREGSALYNNSASASFSRLMIAKLAQQNACEIFTLRLGDKPLATLVLLGSGDRLYTWKIAWDESMARFSPDILLASNVTKTLQERAGFVMADNLAGADHPMIDQIWHERTGISDWSVALTQTANPDLEKFVRAQNRWFMWQSRKQKLQRVWRGLF